MSTARTWNVTLHGRGTPVDFEDNGEPVRLISGRSRVVSDAGVEILKARTDLQDRKLTYQLNDTDPRRGARRRAEVLRASLIAPTETTTEDDAPTKQAKRAKGTASRTRRRPQRSSGDGDS